MKLLADDNGPFKLSLTIKDDAFARSNGAVGNRWVDAHWYYPKLFDEAVILDGMLDATGSTVDTWSPTQPGGYSHWIVGHTLIARQIPWENFEVTIRYSTEDPLAALSQISPALFVNIKAADPLALGVKPVNDSSLNYTTYWQNVFRTENDMGDVFDPPKYYRMIPGTGLPGPVLGTLGPGVFQEITTRVKDGYMRFWWNGVPRDTAPVAVPSYVKDGRKLMVGLDVISIHAEPGYAWPGPVGMVPTPDHIVRDQIVYWCCQPFDGSLA